MAVRCVYPDATLFLSPLHQLLLPSGEGILTSRRTESSLCAISGKKLGRKSVVTALVPKKPVSQPVGKINADQSVGENPEVEGKNKSLTYKIQESPKDVKLS